MLLVWRPTNQPYCAVCPCSTAGCTHLAAYTVPHKAFAFSLWVLGSIFYTAGIWIKMYDTTEWLFSFSLSISMRVLIWTDTDKFIIYWYWGYFSCLYLIHFSCVCIYIYIYIYIYLNPMSLYYYEKANFMCPCFWIG